MRRLATKGPHQECDQLQITIDYTSPELAGQSLNSAAVKSLGALVSLVCCLSAMMERLNPLLHTEPQIAAVKQGPEARRSLSMHMQKTPRWGL